MTVPVGYVERAALRLPRLGVVHLGIKEKTQSGKEYPKRIDWFEVHQDEHTPAGAVAAFRDVYGERPRELDVMFPVDDPEVYMPTYLKAYRGGVGLFCKGPGQNEDGAPGLAMRVYDPEDQTLTPDDVPEGTRPGAMIQVAKCDTETCPLYLTKKCRLIFRLQVLLPKVQGMGVWQLSSSSYNSVQNLRGGLRFVQAFTGGRIAGIPLKLRLVPQEAQVDGKKTVIYVLNVANESVRLLDVLEASKKSWEQVLSLPPPAEVDDDEIPADLFPAEAVAHAEIKASAPAAPAVTPAAGPVIETQAEPVAPAAPPEQDDATRAIEARLEQLVKDAGSAAGWFPAKTLAKINGMRAAGMTTAQVVEALDKEIHADVPSAAAPDHSAQNGAPKGRTSKPKPDSAPAKSGTAAKPASASHSDLPPDPLPPRTPAPVSNKPALDAARPATPAAAGGQRRLF